MGEIQGEMQAIAGCMFAGKTEELLKRVRRHTHAGRSYQLFKPVIDDRYSVNYATSHDGTRLPCITVKNAADLVMKLDDVDVYAIEETQFLDSHIVPVCVDLANNGKIVVVSALSTDFRGEPFAFADGKGHIGDLLARSVVTTLRAICKYRNGDGAPCGRDADMTQRLIDGEPAPYNSPLILVGGAEAYEARCRRHHEVPGRP